MPKLAANLSLLFTELPYLDRFSAAAAAGFEAVEILFPYEVAAKETRRALLSNGLDFVLMNAPPPNYTGGARGFAAEPDQEQRFHHDLRRILRYAGELKPRYIHVMSGYCSGSAAFDCFVRNMQHAADSAPTQQFTVEPLNFGDQPGYFMCDYELAAEALDAIDRSNVTLQYDCYHAQVIHGDAVAVWEKCKSKVSHIQLGDAPGRCEPGGGDIDFAALCAAIAESGYDGWISAEYNPSTKRTEDSLSWRDMFAN